MEWIVLQSVWICEFSEFPLVAIVNEFVERAHEALDQDMSAEESLLAQRDIYVQCCLGREEHKLQEAKELYRNMQKRFSTTAPQRH